MTQRLLVCILILLLNICQVPMARATPPTDLTITYDAETEKLHIQMTHISTNIRKHYIRKIEVFKNEESIKVIRLVIQNSGREVAEDATIKAEKGDVLRVKAFCNEAGTAEASITVEGKGKDESKKSKDAPAQKDSSINQDVMPADNSSKSGY